MDMALRVGDVIRARVHCGISRRYRNKCRRCQRFMPNGLTPRCRYCKAEYREFSEGFYQLVSIDGQT